MSQHAQVTILVPGNVPTMLDEISDGKVAAATAAAKEAYAGIDPDTIDVVTYDGDLDDGLVLATELVQKTDGRDLVVVLTDFVSDDQPRAEQALQELASDGNFVVLVQVSNQPVDDAWAQDLDDHAPFAASVDVVTVAGLADEAIALAEVGNWLDAA